MRICKTLQLKNDPHLIEEYISHHAQGRAWPEVTEGMKKIGILDMEIYIAENRLFMIMDVADDFDHDEAFSRLAVMPRQKEWEQLMSVYQKAEVTDKASEKWKVLRRIYKFND